jgi:creatinine amidohydrolase
VTTYFAEELTSPEFAAFVSAETVGVLPLAAISPHGPHLPLSTDCDIARGYLAHVADVVAEETSVLVLPLQTIGFSVEHQGLPGAFIHRADTLLDGWADLVTPFQVAGGRRLILISSHDGNWPLMELLVTSLRTRFAMLAVAAAWQRFGLPEGLFETREATYGLHGGAVETSLMLHYWPEVVRTEKLADLTSAAEAWDAGTKELKVHGRIRPGWLARDLNPSGAAGNATAASAEKGAAVAQHQLRGFGELIADVASFDISRLGARA